MGGGIPIGIPHSLAERRLNGLYARAGKRALDVLLSAIILVVLSPLMLAIGIVIRLQDGGPAIFRQKRIGRHGRPFDLLKFRSMPVNTETKPSAEARRLPITPFGRAIRRTNADELPQLFNVLAGEMSLVGPRPALPSQTQLIELRSAGNAHECRPGLTGLAQVNAFDGMSPAAKASFDAQYAAGVTLAGDVMILIRTVGYLLKPPPVY